MFMLYFLTIYIVFYTLTLCALQYLLKNTFNTQPNFNSIPHMAYYIINFSKLKYLYFGLIIALTGIPPFLLFFIKFHYLIQISNRIGFIGFACTFFLLFLNMLFYAQLNITKNVSFEWNTIKLKKKNIDIGVLLLINTLLTLFFLSMFFLPDILFVCNLIM
jgi:hypothetical protein